MIKNKNIMKAKILTYDIIDAISIANVWDAKNPNQIIKKFNNHGEFL